MTTVSTIAGRARTTLIDANARTWSDDELVDYVIQGVNKACALLLDLVVDVVQHALEPGMRQTLPEVALVLIDATTNGVGGPVTQQARNELARTQRTWGATAAGQPSFFCYDKRSPQTFLVFPPAGSGASIELVVGTLPPALSSSDELPISAWFENALWAFTCAMALAKNTTRQDLAKTGQYMALFQSDLDRWRASKEAAISTADEQGVNLHDRLRLRDDAARTAVRSGAWRRLR